MRVDCRFYESRTYASGETVRMCRLDLAPEAPWRCPDECSGYKRRMGDVGWSHGSLAPTPAPSEPVELGAGVASMLDEAEDILNAAGAAIIAEHEAKQAKKSKKRKKRR